MTRNLWMSLFAIVASFVVYYAVGPWVAKWIADSLILGVAFGMSWTWGPAAFRSLGRGAIDGADKIVLTIWLAWTVLLLQRAYTMSVAALDDPFWLTSSPVPQLIATLIFLAGVYGLVAPVNAERQLPRREMIVVVSGWFLTGIVTGAAAAYLFITA